MYSSPPKHLCSFTSIVIKQLVITLFLLTSNNVSADCKSELPLSGALSIKNCDPQTQVCISGSEAIHDYVDNMGDVPTELAISLQASPWRLYDQNMRILNIEEIAEMAKPSIKKGVKKIVLNASWTGVPPSHSEKSIAKKLSELLNNFPVTGMDGFLWLSKDGTTHTTRQAFTIRQGQKPYNIVKGDDVMVSLAAGWPINFEEQYIKKRDSDGLMRVGVGLDIFALCPDRALEIFEASAKLKNPIAAYNAAIMRLDRHKQGDIEVASELLSQAAKLGDEKSLVRLKQLKHESK